MILRGAEPDSRAGAPLLGIHGNSGVWGNRCMHGAPIWQRSQGFIGCDKSSCASLQSEHGTTGWQHCGHPDEASPASIPCSGSQGCAVDLIAAIASVSDWHGNCAKATSEFGARDKATRTAAFLLSQLQHIWTPHLSWTVTSTRQYLEENKLV